MKELYYTQMSKNIQAELQNIDCEGCNITFDESERMLNFFQKCLFEIRDYFLSKDSASIEDEIEFFKEIKTGSSWVCFIL